jgi:hypothetical protein
MRSITINSIRLEALFEKQKIATIDELKKALGSNTDMTVFRKLSELSYLSSYSHRGKYYTLRKIAKFYNQGLWSYDMVWFSQYSTLLETVKAFINQSEKGHSAKELKKILHVEAKEPLLQLVLKKQIVRKKYDRIYIYFSFNSKIRKQQEINRSNFILKDGDELKAAIILFYSLLDEKQKRLYAGLESLKFGQGGDGKIASILGLNIITVSKGRKELLSCDTEIERVRKKGGGRKSIKKNS